MFTVLIILAVAFASLYFLLLSSYRFLWIRSETDSSIDTSDLSVSIVIVARNESKHIARCLRSISHNQYPKDRYEIILIDDHSEDDTVSIAASMGIPNLSIIHLAEQITDHKEHNAYKKLGQKIAVEAASGDCLLFTDADVVVGRDWINTMVSYLNNEDLDMSTGPVKYEINNNSWFQSFQALDVAGTMLMTFAGIKSQLWYLANGANIIVRKEAFNDMQQRIPNDKASGDDVFLIQALAKNNPEKVGFVKDMTACVTTFPEQTLKDFWQQRLRWATKTSDYNNRLLQFKIGMLYVHHMLLLILFILGLIGYVWAMKTFVFYLVMKIISDTVVLYQARKDFHLHVPLFHLPITSIMHWPYLLSVGTFSVFQKHYNWKDRRVR